MIRRGYDRADKKGSKKKGGSPGRSPGSLAEQRSSVLAKSRQKHDTQRVDAYPVGNDYKLATSVAQGPLQVNVQRLSWGLRPEHEGVLEHQQPAPARLAERALASANEEVASLRAQLKQKDEEVVSLRAQLKQKDNSHAFAIRLQVLRVFALFLQK